MRQTALALALALTGGVLATGFGALAAVATDGMSSHVLYAQADCKEGEKWNEATGKCESAADGN